ncbi:MAG: hypothetical protein ABWY21_10760 [Rhodococcus sp. (in: high G+C Gram-positive bacteria)]
MNAVGNACGFSLGLAMFGAFDGAWGATGAGAARTSGAEGAATAPGAAFAGPPADGAGAPPPADGPCGSDGPAGGTATAEDSSELSCDSEGDCVSEVFDSEGASLEGLSVGEVALVAGETLLLGRCDTEGFAEGSAVVGSVVVG